MAGRASLSARCSNRGRGGVTALVFGLGVPLAADFAVGCHGVAKRHFTTRDRQCTVCRAWPLLSTWVAVRKLSPLACVRALVVAIVTGRFRSVLSCCQVVLSFSGLLGRGIRTTDHQHAWANSRHYRIGICRCDGDDCSTDTATVLRAALPRHVLRRTSQLERPTPSCHVVAFQPLGLRTRWLKQCLAPRTVGTIEAVGQRCAQETSLVPLTRSCQPERQRSPMSATPSRCRPRWWRPQRDRFLARC